jgi:hypothetical protein
MVSRQDITGLEVRRMPPSWHDMQLPWVSVVPQEVDFGEEELRDPAQLMTMLDFWKCDITIV